ncbi:MAG: hypothetical protein ACRECY_16985 [Phyllobacterium sp.]
MGAVHSEAKLMVQRIWIQPGITRVSKPGFNVLTATDAQLQFNGDWPGGAKFLRGSVSSSITGGERVLTVPYGKTFTVAPLMMVYVVGTAGVWYPGYGQWMWNLSVSQTQNIPKATQWTRTEVRPGLSSVEFQVSNTSTGNSISFTIHYLIFDFRI